MITFTTLGDDPQPITIPEVLLLQNANDADLYTESVGAFQASIHVLFKKSGVQLPSINHGGLTLYQKGQAGFENNLFFEIFSSKNEGTLTMRCIVRPDQRVTFQFLKYEIEFNKTADFFRIPEEKWHSAMFKKHNTVITIPEFISVLGEIIELFKEYTN